MTKDEFWEEVKNVLKITAVLTASIWVKRAVGKMIGVKALDPDIVEHGFEEKKTSVAVNGNPGSNGRIVDDQVNKRVWAPGYQGWVSYRARVRTRDGFVLYDHTTDFGPHHKWYCPLLKAATPCQDCQWLVENPYEGKQCVAVVKMKESPDDWHTGLSDVQRMVENG